MPMGRRLRRPYTKYGLTTAALVVGWCWAASTALGAPATPDLGTPVVCDVPARSRAEIADLLVSSGISTPAATTAGQTLPQGTLADAASTAAMTETVHTWLACQNAGEPLRAWALFSDGYLYRLLSRQGGLSGDACPALATPAPTPSENATVLEIRGQRRLPDGRYGATVVVAYPSVPMPKTFFFFFAEEDSRLVIDGILGEISFSVP